MSPFAECPLCTGNPAARRLCDEHAERLAELEFTPADLDAAAEPPEEQA